MRRDNSLNESSEITLIDQFAGSSDFFKESASVRGRLDQHRLNGKVDISAHAKQTRGSLQPVSHPR
ncbi:MAG: hypothetical protein ACYC0V_02880 [Armatimonadota bacterium]